MKFAVKNDREMKCAAQNNVHPQCCQVGMIFQNWYEIHTFGPIWCEVTLSRNFKVLG